ncbi:hypothetical protein [Rhodococcus erythropolis]|uniref:hypothetical protein n=1 Tax=Rhodococcus erythropolis TaxID=1833 RepID=UPI0024B6DAD2|nr:hypothetical protein [Rhodococcus erythropolis]MDJ0015610.1 hypothetical protein [Rhodococcus erythropolis]
MDRSSHANRRRRYPFRRPLLRASTSRLADTRCAGFVGAAQVVASLENHTITRRVDDLLLMWRGTDPAADRMVEEASL